MKIVWNYVQRRDALPSKRRDALRKGSKNWSDMSRGIVTMTRPGWTRIGCMGPKGRG